MKKILVIFEMVVMLALASLSLSGCGIKATGNVGEQESVSALALVIGNHACSKELNLNSSIVKEKVMQAIQTYGFVSVVGNDGVPELIAADNYDIPEQYKHADAGKLQSDAEVKTVSLLQKVGTVMANDPESDILESIRLAVRSLASAPESCEKTILIIDTGLSTAGYLDFRNHLLDGSAEDIARALSDKKAVPDLTNITVIWQQMGDVGSPQAMLSPNQLLRLEDIWRNIIEMGGGTLIITQTVHNNGIMGEGLPFVSTVEVKEEDAVSIDVQTKQTESGTITDFQKPMILEKEEVRFISNSADYIDKEAAVYVLEPVAEYLLAHQDTHILIIGTTAGDECGEFEISLSSARAETVKNTLMQLGVNEGQMKTIGMGSKDPWHMPDIETNSPEAEINRKVVLLDAATEDAKRILEL